MWWTWPVLSETRFPKWVFHWTTSTAGVWERQRWFNTLMRWIMSLSFITEAEQLHFQPSEPLPYNVIFDELLIAQEELLPSQDGRLWPGAIGSGARVHSSQHLLLRSFGDAVDHFICRLQGRKQKNIWDLVFTQSFIKYNVKSELPFFLWSPWKTGLLPSGFLRQELELLTGLWISSHSEVLDSINFPSINSLVVGWEEKDHKCALTCLHSVIINW